MRIVIIPNDGGDRPSKLANVELSFGGVGNLRAWLSASLDTCANPQTFGPLLIALRELAVLDGLRVTGFAVWARGDGGRNVTWPAGHQQEAVLQPNLGASGIRLTAAILAAYVEAMGYDPTA